MSSSLTTVSMIIDLHGEESEHTAEVKANPIDPC